MKNKWIKESEKVSCVTNAVQGLQDPKQIVFETTKLIEKWKIEDECNKIFGQVHRGELSAYGIDFSNCINQLTNECIECMKFHSVDEKHVQASCRNVCIREVHNFDPNKCNAYSFMSALIGNNIRQLKSKFNNELGGWEIKDLTPCDVKIENSIEDKEDKTNFDLKMENENLKMDLAVERTRIEEWKKLRQRWRKQARQRDEKLLSENKELRADLTNSLSGVKKDLEDVIFYGDRETSDLKLVVLTLKDIVKDIVKDIDEKGEI